MARKHRTDRSVGRVQIRAKLHGAHYPCAWGSTSSYLRSEYKGERPAAWVRDLDVVVVALEPRTFKQARTVRIVLPDGIERRAYARNVRTADGRPVMRELRRIGDERRAARREREGLDMRRARASIEAAERQIKKHEAHVKRLETAIKAWRRKLAQRERVLRELTERAPEDSGPALPGVQ